MREEKDSKKPRKKLNHSLLLFIIFIYLNDIYKLLNLMDLLHDYLFSFYLFIFILLLGICDN